VIEVVFSVLLREIGPTLKEWWLEEAENVAQIWPHNNTQLISKFTWGLCKTREKLE